MLLINVLSIIVSVSVFLRSEILECALLHFNIITIMLIFCYNGMMIHFYVRQLC